MNDTVYALTGARLIDGTGRPPIPKATVVVDGRTIAQAGPAAQVTLPSDMRIIDLHGQTLMPGLIDGHVHLLAYAGAGHKDVHLWNVLTFIEEQTLHAAANAHKALEAGVTTVRDMAGSRPEISVKHAVEDGVLAGARVLVCGLVGMTAGHADMFCPANIDQRLWRTADGVDECRKRVREYARDGADWIKICTSGGVLSVGDKSEWRNYTLDETRAIVDEAHGLGMRVAAHAHSRSGILQALTAGVDTLEHGSQLDDELIVLMLRQKTWLCPTLAISEYLLGHGEQRGVPAESLAKARAMSERRREAVQKAYHAGVSIFMGTDSCNTMAFGAHAWELQLMCELIGLSPMESLVAATSAAACAIGVGDLTGRIEPGKRADLLVVDGDPLADIGVLQCADKLKLVLKEGRASVNRTCL